MPIRQGSLFAFNRGLVSDLAAARVQDIDRISISASVMENWMPRVLGSMMLRPGTQYIGSTRSNAEARLLGFVFSTNDVAKLELTDSNLRVWVNDALITRAAHSSTITNGSFAATLTGWTQNDDAGAVSAWGVGGYMNLTGNGTAYAIRYQQVAIASADRSTVHALRINVDRGPAILRIGSTAGDDDVFAETSLGTGAHSIAFTPAFANIYIQFQSPLKRTVRIADVDFEAAGTMTLPTPWTASDLPLVRGGPDSQSGDIVYVACKGIQPRKIERRDNGSWSVVKYEPEDGPYRIPNTTPITITPSGLTGSITMAASKPLWTVDNVGSLYRITSTGQHVTASVAAENTFTSAIRVTNVGDLRKFTYTIAGTWSATITLQRSLESATGPWVDINSFGANTSATYDDGLDNQVAWYRIGIKTGGYTSGTADLSLDYTLGFTDGVVRISTFTDTQNVAAEVITDLGGTDATDDWAEGKWSDRRGWPTAVGFTDGRIIWTGKDSMTLSVSDAFESFDPETIGDSGPIDRSIGYGPVDTINWVVDLGKLIIGSEGSEFVIESSAIDEPLTPTNFQIRTLSTQGSAGAPAVRIDDKAIFVQRGGVRLFEAAPVDSFSYASTDISLLVPEIGKPGIKWIAAQRQPDNRIHAIRTDGTVAIHIYDRAENVLCWTGYSTEGFVEDCLVLPGIDGSGEDQVYYVVRRTVNGSTVRYIEKWALEEDCQGGILNRQLDCHVTYSGIAVTTLTGLSHLEGKTVAVWGDGKDLGTFTVSSGNVSGLPESVTNAVIGVPYTANWKSNKLVYPGRYLNQRKRIAQLGVLLRNAHQRGLLYGPDFNSLDGLPEMKSGAEVGSDTIHAEYDEEMFVFHGNWSTDSRVCLRAVAPKPCTILGLVMAVDANEKV